MNPTNQSLLKIMIGIVILAGAVATLVIMTSDYISPGSNKLLSITFSLIFYGITGSICWAAARKKEYNLLGNAGMIISVVTFLLTTILIVGEVESEDMLKLVFCLMIASIALAHISFLFYITVQNNYTAIARILATVFISLFSLLIITKVFDVDSRFFFMGGISETYIRMVAASLILDLTATLLVPLCNRLQNTTTTELVITSEPPATTGEIQQPGSEQ
jgi:hypothetical protein